MQQDENDLTRQKKKVKYTKQKWPNKPKKKYVKYTTQTV